MTSPGARVRLEFAAKAFLWCSFLGSLAAGAIRLHGAAMAAEEHRVDLGVWTVESRPDWCTPEDLRGVRDASGLGGRWAGLLDPRGGAAVWEALERSPRVRRVVAIRRRLPDRFEVLLDVRRPVAAVRLPGTSPRYVEIDEEGRALGAPQPVRPVRAGAPLRIVTGVAAPGAVPGESFGPDVVEAAALAAELEHVANQEHREALLLLDEIDVTNFRGRRDRGASEVLLRATGGTPAGPEPGAPPGARSSPARTSPRTPCVVEWGRARSADPWDPEPTFGAKTAHVLQALRMFPRLEGLSRVRVAFEDLIVVPASAPR